MTPLFFNNTTNLWKKTKWKEVTNKISSILDKEKNIFVIDDNIDIKTLKVLKNLKNLHFKNVQIRKLNTNLQKNTFESNYSKKKLIQLMIRLEFVLLLLQI